MRDAEYQINFQVDAPEGTLPLKEHCVKNSEGKIKLDVALSDDVTPTWRALEAVSSRNCTGQ